MTDLHVKSDSLRTGADGLRVLRDDVANARAYTMSYIEVPDGGGVIFDMCESSMKKVAQGVLDILGELSSVTNVSANELDQTARMYDKTDHAVAAAHDKKYAEVEALQPGYGYEDRAGDPIDTVPTDPGTRPPSDGEDHPPTSGSGSGGGGGGGGSW
ncbi:hypothetical protein H5V45_13355 [Nocardioides sp. KIGAM211]|uniref:Excreted virulence factor EspC, type VII ESX diderm n=1 Tax=Nocardioides luti TaxID=2761101 RepID=A0A7X0RHJ0_9ACTN|nr:hypothetical protein [Nocardioides luti]MBB6628307.1 hypothetical protein [Nocardioides luti]